MKFPKYIGPIVYATLAEAVSRSTSAPAALPEDLWIVLPEVTPRRLEPGEFLQFGVTMLRASSIDAAREIGLISEGLDAVGSHGAPKTVLGGNFEVVDRPSLISNSAPHQNRWHEIQACKVEENSRFILAAGRVQIRFVTPLRLCRELSKCTSGHRFIDAEYFSLEQLWKGIQRRLKGFGLDPCNTADVMEQPGIVSSKKVEWIETSYGDARSRKFFGGIYGFVEVTDFHPEVAKLLAWGRHIGVGELTRFGFGRFDVAIG